MPEAYVWVRCRWNDGQPGRVRRADLAGPYWDTTDRIPRRGRGLAMLHAVISCAAVIEGELAHTCERSTAPHLLKVCASRADNDGAAMAELEAAAGPRPG